MIVALLSDIHSNYYYFKQVLAVIEKHSPDLIVCLGDIVGYYDDPESCIRTIREKKIVAIKGNHDKFLVEEETYDFQKDSIYRITSQKEQLKKEDIAYLKNLPDEVRIDIGGKVFYFTHSKPGNCQEYFYDVRELDKDFVRDIDFYCFGHTHIPLITYYFGCCIINPGSVGQPRDYSQKPSFVIVNTLTDSSVLYKVDVNKEEFILNLQRKKFNESVINILIR